MTKQDYIRTAEMIVAEPRNHAGLCSFVCKVYSQFDNFDEYRFRSYVAKLLHDKGLSFAAYAVVPEPSDDTQPPEWDREGKCWTGEPASQQLFLQEDL